MDIYTYVHKCEHKFTYMHKYINTNKYIYICIHIVDIGDSTVVTIVTNAPNIREGTRTCVATVGTAIEIGMYVHLFVYTKIHIIRMYIYAFNINICMHRSTNI
jgi:hypothetical protein